MCEITIITPTYNRSATLATLYTSLTKQTIKNFVWLIIDDGSIDNSEEIIRSFIKQGLISIEYHSKVNGGKHTALNYAYKFITTPLSFIVDSDDWLPSDAISTILFYYHKYQKIPHLNICGFCFLRYHSNGMVNTAYFPNNEEIKSYVDARINSGIGGDKAEVFYTDILKKFPFPIYKNEKFVPEDLIWLKMSQCYEMVYINQCIYISDYLEDGLTKSGKRMKIQSPNGMLERSIVFINDSRVHCKVIIKMMLLYIIYSQFAKISLSDQIQRIHHKTLFCFLLPAGYILYLLWKFKYEDRK